MTEIQTEETQPEAIGLEFNISLFNGNTDEVSVNHFIAGVETGVLVKMRQAENGVAFDIVASGESEKPSTLEDLIGLLESTAELLRESADGINVTEATEGEVIPEEDPREGDIEDELDRLDEEADRG